MSDTKLITLSNPQAPAAEAYRSLRTNLMFSNVDAPPKTLVIAATTLNEADNTVAANLAVAMAQSERKTLLVDCDLRRPNLHNIWGLDNSTGLTTMIVEDSDDAIRRTEVENLWVLTSGPKPPNPADLLESKRLAITLERLADAYEIVLFCAPPVIAVTDAALLASKLDGILLVMSAGRTRRDQARQAKALLEKIKINVVGVVLTNAAVDASKGYYGE